MKNAKRIIIHTIVPILLAILTYFISISFIFRIPDPRYIGGCHPATYLFGIILAFGTLAVSSIISVILYVGGKK